MNIININGCVFGCDCESCSGWLLAPEQRAIFKWGKTHALPGENGEIVAELADLTDHGCTVDLYTAHWDEDGAFFERDYARVTFPNGRSIPSLVSDSLIFRITGTDLQWALDWMDARDIRYMHFGDVAAPSAL